jgi:putative Holliday junction resolvase
MSLVSGSVLAFDYGRQRIGIAIGQTITGTANALTTLPCIQQRPAWEAIAKLIGEWRPVALVVGLPLNMDGTEHDISAAARRFARQLQERARLPVYLSDERLSSRAAEERLSNSAASKKKRRDKASIDALAAQIILETWLGDFQRGVVGRPL